MSGFTLRAADFAFVGQGLRRPECVLAQQDGTLWVSDERATALRIAPDGGQALLGPKVGTPNGLALDREGGLYVADIGAGCVYRLLPDGRHEMVLERLEGRALGAVNFVYLDSRERLWITVSTRTEPRAKAVATPTPDGYVLLRDASGVRCVAEGLCFTNEVRIDRAGRFLYIAETALGRVVRARIGEDGSLGRLEPFGPAPVFPGARIDGIAFDADGNLWITEITRNALVVISAEAEARTVFEDPEGTTLVFPTSIAFGGTDLQTAYVGSLKMDRLARFRAPRPGLPLVHWRS